MPLASPASILLVEDEPIVAMDIVDCFRDAGFLIVGPVANLSDALRVVQTESFDAALVDANLAGVKVDDLAAALADRAIPFAFVTGYARENLPQAFPQRPSSCEALPT